MKDQKLEILRAPHCLNCDLDMKELSPTQFVWACPNCNFRVNGHRQYEWWDKYAHSNVRYDESGYLENE